MKTPAGATDLRFRVRFDKRIEQADSGGGIEAWTVIGTGSFIRWCDIRPLKGGEGVQAQRLTGTQPVIIIARVDSSMKTVNPSWRAVQVIDGVDGAAYALKTAQDMEMGNQFITLLGVAGDADS